MSACARCRRQHDVVAGAPVVTVMRLERFECDLGVIAASAAAAAAGVEELNGHLRRLLQVLDQVTGDADGSAAIRTVRS